MPTIRVPTDQPTIAAAMAVANPGDVISLEQDYTGEVVTVTVDGLTFFGDFSNTGIRLTLGVSVSDLFLAGTAPWAVVDNALDNTITAPDSLSGPDGSNIFTVSRGNDRVGGGVNIGGFDTLVVNYGYATLDITTTGDPAQSSGTIASFSDGGNNSVDFDSIERYRVTTGSGNDVIVTGNANDTVSTGTGNDSIDTRGGVAIVNGGGGTDFWTASSLGPITLDLNLAGLQNIGGGSQVASIERVNLSLSGASTIVTRTGNPNDGLNDTIDDPTGGADTVTVGGGFDTATLGLGFNTLIVDYGTETRAITTIGDPVSANGQYTDGLNTGVTFGGISAFQITTGSGADSIVTGNGDDIVSTGGGNDTIETNFGNAIVNGGSGTDYWIANLDSIFPSNLMLDLNLAGTQAIGNGDTVTSIERVNLTLSGPAVIRTRVGNPNDGLNDTITGSSNDTITVGGGNDVYNGGFGLNTLIVNYATETRAITTIGDPTTGNGQYTDALNTGVTFTNVSTFRITTGAGSDVITTGNGDDFVQARGGADMLDGKGGIDTVSYADKTASVVVALNGSNAANVKVGGVVEDTIRGFENIIGGSGSNTLTGDGTANILTGGSVADTLNGGTGADTLSGLGGDDRYFVDTMSDVVIEANGGGTDVVLASANYALRANQEIEVLRANAGSTGLVLTGNEQVNTLIGGAGGDRLAGGLGADYLTGGGAADVFVFKALADSGLGSARDTISDFAEGTDRINLSLIDANTTASSTGDDAFSLIEGAFTGQAGQLHQVTTAANNKLIEGDVDGDARADFQILLVGQHTLHAGDFVL